MLTAEDKQILDEQIAEYTDLCIKQMRQLLTKKNVTGDLSDSITSKVNYEGEGFDIQFEMLEYGKFVQSGRRPGKYPPIRPLLTWVSRRGMPDRAAYAIQKSIASRGIKSYDFQRPIYDNLNILADAIEKGIVNVIVNDINTKQEE